MGNGDLSTDLALGILPSASAGRAAEEHAANPDAKVKARRRPRPEAEAEYLDDSGLPSSGLSSDASEPPAHQLDRLA